MWYYPHSGPTGTDRVKRFVKQKTIPIAPTQPISKRPWGPREVDRSVSITW